MSKYFINVPSPKQFQGAMLDAILKRVEEVAKDAEATLKDNIKNSIIREGSTGNLEDSMFIEPIPNGYGLGNIPFLNEHAKQWHWLNYGVAQTGRKIPPGTDENPKIRGHFEPETNGRFVKGQPKFNMNPKKPIEAKNFIENTLADIKAKLK